LENKDQSQEVALETKPRKLSYFNRFALLLNYGVILLLLISYLSAHVSPGNFWMIAFFGLCFPIFFVLNLFFVVYWLIQWKMKFLFSFLALLIGFNYASKYFQINLREAPAETGSAIEKLKLMSFNVRLFDLYNWSHNKETRSKIFDFIKDESPNIICLQEFFNSDKGDFQNFDTLCKFQKAKYGHREYTVTLHNDNDHWGIATFSSYPIVNRGKISFHARNSNNMCIYTDIKINNDTIRVYNMHLQSVHFRNRDYKFISDLVNNKDSLDLEYSKNILRRLKTAFIKRSSQVDLVAEHIKSSPYPVIVCGDFNDTPCSYAYNVLSQGLTDAFVESGNGFGRTYIGIFPSFRIDYLLHSPSIHSYDFQTIPEELSDHYPISCYLSLKKQ